MCKANYVHYVKGKMSGRRFWSVYYASSSLVTASVNARQVEVTVKKELEIRPNVYIIMFTYEHAGSTTNEAIVLAQPGHAESSCESSAARELSRQRVFRSGRCGAGQVRDAAAGRYRQATGPSGGKDIWLFAPVVLSGTGSLSGSWACRALATETWAALGAQAHARTDAVCGATPARRTRDLQSSVSPTNRTTLRCLGSPAQYRSSAAASKKTPLSPQAAAICLVDRRLVAAYEEIRSQAVQGRQRGPGLALMMARGLRCWMEACSQLFANQGSCTEVMDRAALALPSSFNGELVVLLASMLLRRASKGIA
jgi:hypothetical protein